MLHFITGTCFQCFHQSADRERDKIFEKSHFFADGSTRSVDFVLFSSLLGSLDQLSDFFAPYSAHKSGEHDVIRLHHYLRFRWPSCNSVRLWNCRLGFDSKSGQLHDFKIGIYCFPV